MGIGLTCRQAQIRTRSFLLSPTTLHVLRPACIWPWAANAPHVQLSHSAALTPTDPLGVSSSARRRQPVHVETHEGERTQRDTPCNTCMRITRGRPAAPCRWSVSPWQSAEWPHQRLGRAWAGCRREKRIDMSESKYRRI